MTTPMLPLLPLTSTGCSCCTPAPPAKATSAPAIDTTGPTPEVSSSFEVAGLTCGHCVATVTNAIRALEQVEDVRIDLVPGGVSTVTVIGAYSGESVRQAINKAGYTVLSS